VKPASGLCRQFCRTVAVLGARSKKQAIETALRESIAQRRRQKLLNALGTIDLDLTVEQLHRDRTAE